jgi:hypothetical protein
MEDDYLCIQMELCEGSVENIDVFDKSKVFPLLRDILNALDALHRYGKYKYRYSYSIYP